MQISQRATQLLAICAMAALFALLFPAEPSISSNQHTYLLHGLAQSIHPELATDALLQGRDPVLLFSFVSAKLVSHLGVGILDVLYRVCLWAGFLGVAILAVHARTWDVNAVVLALLGFALVESQPGFELLETIQPGLFWALWDGHADQYLWGKSLQPSSVIFVYTLSLIFFARQQLNAAVWLLCIPPMVHPSSIVISGVLLVAYLATQRVAQQALPSWGPVAGLGICGVLVMWYVQWVLKDASAAENLSATQILYQERVGFHANTREWWSALELLKVLLIAGSIALVQNQPLRQVLIFSTAVMYVVILLQYLTQSEALGMLFISRISAIVYPFAVLMWMLVATQWLLSKLAIRTRKRVLIGGLVLGLSTLMATESAGFLREAQAKETPMTPFEPPRSLGVSVIPESLYWYRIQQRSPVFVDWKNHPYSTRAILAWHERLRRNRVFYGLRQPRCSDVLLIYNDVEVRQVVMPEGQILDCHLFEAKQRVGKGFVVYERN